MAQRIFQSSALAATLLLAPALARSIPLRNVELKAHLDEYAPNPGFTNYSASWTYIHHDGREYAAIGVGDGNPNNDPPGGGEGTAIYNVTNPSQPRKVGFIPGPPSLWREMKQYRSWLYVVSEGTGLLEGLQVISMANPEQPVLDTTITSVVTSHTVAVDTARALLVCNGTKYKASPTAYPPAGMRILSLANPEAPVELTTWPSFPITSDNFDTTYVHDSVPVGNRLYASSIYPGIQRVFDITNPYAPVMLATWKYPGGFTHNAWPDKTGNWLYLTDEKNGEPLKVFDIANLSAPKLFNTYTSNPVAIVHNVHVWGDELYAANYTEGIRVLDISDPGHPAEYGYADTYAGISGDFNGVWDTSVLPSGTVIASDRNSGLWLFRPQRNYGLLRVKVTDAGTGQPIEGAKLFRGAQAESLVTTADGVGVFALDPGSHTITVERFGYASGTVMRSAAVGSRDTVVLALQAKPKVTFNGQVRDTGTQAPLEEAEVILAYGPLHDHTDATGQYSLTDVPQDLYRVEVRSPGYVPVAFDRQIGPGPVTMTFQLRPAAVWNPIEAGTGWLVGATGDVVDNARGKWILVDPQGTEVGGGTHAAMPTARVAEAPAVPLAGFKPGATPAHEGHREAEGMRAGPVQPEDDRTPAGTQCFVTGQGSGPSDIEGADLDGQTTLTGPTLNATGMTIPTIAYWRWFFSSTGGPHDYLAVQISNDNGANWVPADTTRDLQGHWQEKAIRIADVIAPTSQMKVRFVAVDGGGASVVEVAIDDLTLYDAALQPVGSFPEPAPARLAFRQIWPNPSRGAVQAILDLPANGTLRVDVLDLQGRRVATVFDGEAEAGPVVIAWDGADQDQHTVEAGIYFLRARAGRETVTARFTSLR